MASFLKIDIHFAKYLGSSLKGRKSTRLHSWIIPQAQKHWICNGFIPQIGCSFCKVPGKLSLGNKPTTYILGSFCKLKSTKLQWLSFLKIDVHFAKYPLPEDNHSWFRLSGMWDWNSLHYTWECWSYCCTLCGVKQSQSHKSYATASIFCWEFMPFAKQFHQLWTSRPSSAIALRFSSI